MYDGPIREGSRGGRDQFSWEAVKGDKDREFYLGHSVKALVGQWQKNKDPYWYTRSKNAWQTELAEEVKAVKEKEEELMLEALGMKPPKQKPAARLKMRLQKYEVDGMLKRREKEDGDQEDDDIGGRGLGFRRTAVAMNASMTHEVMSGVGIPSNSDIHQPLKQSSVPDDRQAKGSAEKKRKKEKSDKTRKKRKTNSPSLMDLQRMRSSDAQTVPIHKSNEDRRGNHHNRHQRRYHASHNGGRQSKDPGRHSDRHQTSYHARPNGGRQSNDHGGRQSNDHGGHQSRTHRRDGNHQTTYQSDHNGGGHRGHNGSHDRRSLRYGRDPQQ